MMYNYFWFKCWYWPIKMIGLSGCTQRGWFWKCSCTKAFSHQAVLRKLCRKPWESVPCGTPGWVSTQHVWHFLQIADLMKKGLLFWIPKNCPKKHERMAGQIHSSHVICNKNDEEQPQITARPGLWRQLRGHQNVGPLALALQAPPLRTKTIIRKDLAKDCFWTKCLTSEMLTSF